MSGKFTNAYMPKTMVFPHRVVDRSKCKQCKRCYDSCPSYGYVWGDDNYPVPNGYGGYTDACLNCWNCVAVCPHDAIRVEGLYSVSEGRHKTYLTKKMSYPRPFGDKEKREYRDFEKQLTEVERVIYTRRSNRLFNQKKPVPEELINRVLEAGRYAPSAGNNLPYKFLVLTNKDVIKELEHGAMFSLRLLKNLYFDKSGKGKRPILKRIFFTIYSWLDPQSMDPRPFTAVEKADQFNEKIYWDAPVVIMILKNKMGISNPDLDIGICCQNMVLAAHSLGLGTCYVSLAIKSLNLPLMSGFRKKIGATYPWVPVTCIALGFPVGKVDGVVSREVPQVEWIR
jgi:nitroreductase/NAD-dependent dihydropyrimidine dehydrogenase PreA subunit